MLHDDQGRWGSSYNAAPFAAHVERCLDTAEEALPIVLDLEPPITQMRRLLAGDLRALASLRDSPRREEGQQILVALKPQG